MPKGWISEVLPQPQSELLESPPPNLGRCLSVVLILRARVLTEITALPRKPGSGIQSEAPTPLLGILPEGHSLTIPNPTPAGSWGPHCPRAWLSGNLGTVWKANKNWGRPSALRGQGASHAWTRPLVLRACPLRPLRGTAAPAPSPHRASRGHRWAGLRRARHTRPATCAHSAPQRGTWARALMTAVPRPRVPTRSGSSLLAAFPSGPQGEG